MNRTLRNADATPRIPAPVVFPRRPQGVLTCPHCWTTQQALRNRCYHCGASFHFEEEVSRSIRRGKGDSANGLG